MNERIKELVVQSGGNFANGSLEFAVVFGELKDLEKFTELIVKECVRVVDGMADPEDSERYFWAIQNASQKIREHFGVEK